MAIDVLAAIDGVLKIEEVVTSDDYCGSENCAKCRSEAKRFHALRRARAAVAELLDADKEYDAALTSWDALLVTAAKQRRAAALARMGVGA